MLGSVAVQGIIHKGDIIPVGAAVAGDFNAEGVGNRFPVVVEGAAGIVLVKFGPIFPADINKCKTAVAAPAEGLDEPEVFVDEFCYHIRSIYSQK